MDCWSSPKPIPLETNGPESPGWSAITQSIVPSLLPPGLVKQGLPPKSCCSVGAFWVLQAMNIKTCCPLKNEWLFTGCVFNVFSFSSQIWNWTNICDGTWTRYSMGFSTQFKYPTGCFSLKIHQGELFWCGSSIRRADFRCGSKTRNVVYQGFHHSVIFRHITSILNKLCQFGFSVETELLFPLQLPSAFGLLAMVPRQCFGQGFLWTATGQ